MQGRHIFHEDALLDVSDCRIWLDEDNAECLRQRFMACNVWNLCPDATRDEEIKHTRRLGVLQNGRFLKEQEHSRFTRGQLHAAASLRVDCAMHTHYESTKIALNYLFQVRHDSRMMKTANAW
mgnify:CR=1 FL=1